MTNTDMLHLNISDLRISPRCFTTGRFATGNIQDQNVQVRSNGFEMSSCDIPGANRPGPVCQVHFAL